MQRLVSYRQGDRAEYLAQYILSAFAISVPVPRQEDVGSDFHCSLLRREGDCLRPYLPFNIQIKRLSKDILKDGVRFGGLTKANVWRKHEIDQLCQTDTPFLIGLVDSEGQWMDLFTTVSRYFVKVGWNGKPVPREVALMPYKPDGEGHLGDGTVEALPKVANAPDNLWVLPIGQPILRISIVDSEDEARCEEIKRLLEVYLRNDQANAVLIRLGLGYFEWPLIMRPHNVPKEIGIALAYGPPGTQVFDQQLANLCKLAASILASYKDTGRKREILPWLPLIEKLPLQMANPLIQQVIADAVAFAKS